MTPEEIRIMIKDAIVDAIDNNTFTSTCATMYLLAYYMVTGTYETEYIEILKKHDKVLGKE